MEQDFTQLVTKKTPPSEAKQKFAQLGLVCAQPPRSKTFRLGRTHFRFAWGGSSTWGCISEQGLLEDSWFRIGRTRSASGRSRFVLSLGWFALMIARGASQTDPWAGVS